MHILENIALAAAVLMTVSLIFAITVDPAATAILLGLESAMQKPM